MAKAADYIDNVLTYDTGANVAVVQKICNYLGIALANRDGSQVLCSNETELHRIVNGFCAKKLDQAPNTAAAACKNICATMKKDHMKSRVTFYYLLTQNANRLEQFGG